MADDDANITEDSKPVLTIQEEMLMALNNYTHGNELYTRLLSHVIYGQLFKDLRVPTGKNRVYGGRTSVFAIRNQGTGKNEPVVFIRRMCRYIETKAKKEIKLDVLRYEKATELTDAAMIGTVVDEKIKGAGITRNIIEGLLSEKKSDVLFLEEANILFQANAYKNSLVRYINTALNRDYGGENKVVKFLRDSKIEYYSRVSIIATTAPTKNITDELIHSGFLRRHLLFYQNLSSEELSKNANDDITDLGTQPIDDETKLEEIGNRLYEIYKTHFIIQVGTEYKPKNVNVIYKDNKEIIDFFKNCIQYIKEDTLEISEDRRQKLFEMITAYKNYALILASHNAVLKNNFDEQGNVIVTADEVRKVWEEIILPLLMRILNMYLTFEGKSTEERQFDESHKKFIAHVVELLKTQKDNRMVIGAFNKEVMDYAKQEKYNFTTPPSVLKHIEKAVTNGRVRYTKGQSIELNI